MGGKIEELRNKTQSQSTQKSILEMRKDQTQLEKSRLDILKENATQDYYVSYSLNNLFPNSKIDKTIFDLDKDIRVLVSGGQNILTIRYQMPNEKGAREENIVVATSKKQVEPEKAKKELEQYFIQAKKFVVKKDNIQPAKYMANLQSKGWELTNEGLDIFSSIKTEHGKEIKRTHFLKDELKYLPLNQKDDNQKRHYDNETYYRAEETQLMDYISDYLKETYSSLPYKEIEKIEDTEKKAKLKEQYTKVLEYCLDCDKNRTQNSDSLFSQIFTKTQLMSSIAQKADMDPSKAKTIYQCDIETVIKPIKETIECLPNQYRDIEKEQPIWSYLATRTEIDVNSMKEEKIGIEDQQELICIGLDHAIEEKRQLDRNELKQEVSKEMNDRRITSIDEYKRREQKKDNESEIGIG